MLPAGQPHSTTPRTDQRQVLIPDINNIGHDHTPSVKRYLDRLRPSCHEALLRSSRAALGMACSWVGTSCRGVPNHPAFTPPAVFEATQTCP